MAEYDKEEITEEYYNSINIDKPKDNAKTRFEDTDWEKLADKFDEVTEKNMKAIKEIK